MKILITLLLISTQSFAYTLNNNFGAAFSSNEVRVTVDEQTTCVDLNLTVYELSDMVKKAASTYWNTVPTSALEVKSSGFNQAVTNINSGVLCAPTDDTCISSAGINIIPPVDGIVIGCNDNNANFDTSHVLAVTVPNNFSGRKIKGAVVLLNTNSAALKNLSYNDKVAVIAHELGHALGLGHTDDKAAIMYYRTIDQRKKLGEDDMRGISYLYPIKLDFGGLLGGCGTISTDTKNPPKNPPFIWMVISFGGLVSLYELIRFLKRTQTRSAL